MSQPVIGVTLDSEEPGGYSKLPWYALRQNYCEAVARAGALPILLPHEPEQAGAYLERIDGLVVTGGAFDVDPALFGAATRHATVKLKTKRTAFEIEITKGALARNMPVLGICGGQQLLNVVLGGTLSTLYPVCVAHAHDRLSGDRILAVSSSLILVNGVGSVLGPLIGTIAMRWFEIDGVLYMMAGAAGMLTVLALGRSLAAASPLRLARPFTVLAPELAALAHGAGEPGAGDATE